MVHYKRTGKNWAAWEEKFLKEHLGKSSYIELAGELQRTPRAIERKAATVLQEIDEMPCLHNPFDLWWVSEYVVDYYRENGV